MAEQDKIDRMLGRWSLQPEDLDVGPQVLGAGSFGEVRAGILRDGNSSIEVAVKLLPMNGNCQETWNKIGCEAVLLAKVSERCKSTSRLYGICLKDDKFCLVMKKYATSLEKKMDEYPNRKAPQEKVEQWALGICEALVELHAQNVVIRDLKPSNVLLDEFDGAILADFGISRMVESTISQRRASTTVAGTFAYMAPEAFTTRVVDRSSKVDVWSLGCLLLELYTGKAPWEGLDMANIFYQVYQSKEHPTIPKEMNRDLIDALSQCFVHDPTKRASATSIREVLKKAYRQAAGAACQQCTSKLSMQPNTHQSLDFHQTYVSHQTKRIESLERELEALTLHKDEAGLRLCASEENVAKLKVVIQDQCDEWANEKALLEHKLAISELRLCASEENVAELKVDLLVVKISNT